MSLSVLIAHASPGYHLRTGAVVELPSCKVVGILSDVEDLAHGITTTHKGTITDQRQLLVMEFDPMKQVVKIGDIMQLPFVFPADSMVNPLAAAEGDAQFKFELSDRVQLGTSKLSGIVDGRTQYRTNPNRYYVLYEDEKGVPTDGFFYEDTLTLVPDGDVAAPVSLPTIS